MPVFGLVLGIHAEPDWSVLVREFKRPGVNLLVLWEEYRAVHPEGYAYSRFCQLFREFERRLSPTMRQQHVAGHKAFVDYSGKLVPITDPVTGEVRTAEIFVAVLGASSLTYAEATWTQTLPDWIGAHVRMFRFWGAAPRLLVPDNLKSAIHKASFYDPEVNRSYGAMATHYGVGILPARPRSAPATRPPWRPGVRFAQSYILGRLRNVTFFSLAECNAAIAAALERMNSREMRRLGMSRRQLFEAIERPVMQSLPQDDFRVCRVASGPRRHRLPRRGGKGFFYSVPHALIREQVDTRATQRTIEVFHHGRRVAAHARRYGGPRHGTQPEHMPSAHRRYAEWTPERLQRDARGIGPATEALIIAVMARRPHPEQGFRTCLGMLRLFRGLEASPGREGQPARRRDRRAVLRLGRLDPQTPARPGRRRSRPRTAHPCCTRTSAAPATTIRRTTLLTHPTLDLLANLGLHGMAKGFHDLANNPEAASLGHAEWLGILLERESTLRQQKWFQSRAKAAKLRHLAAVEDVDYRTPRGLDRAMFLKLASCDWIRERRHCLLTGPSGVGKSWLACALGYKACRENLSVFYQRVPRLFAALALARGDGSYAKLLRQLARVDLLILDDWGPEPLIAEQQRDLLEIVEDRYSAGSLIITSQVPIDRWYEIVGNPTLADAILDRVIHNAPTASSSRARACASGASLAEHYRPLQCVTVTENKHAERT